MDQFFCSNDQRDGTGYIEFVKGVWDHKSYWNNDGLYITPDMLWKSGLGPAICVVIPDFDVYGISYEISTEQWAMIGKESMSAGGTAAEAFAEADRWLAGNSLVLICV